MAHAYSPTRRRRTLLDAPATDELGINLFSAGPVIIELSPTAKRIIVSESLRADLPVPTPNESDIQIGDRSVIFRNQKYPAPSLTRLTIPADLANRVVVNIATRGASVDFYGKPGRPIRVGDTMFFHSKVRGSDLSLTGRDLQLIGPDSSFIAGHVSMEPPPRGSLYHAIQAIEGAALDLDCVGITQPLHVLTETPGTVNVTGVSELILRGQWGSEDRSNTLRTTDIPSMPQSRSVA